MVAKALPLDGVVVVEFAQLIAGPYAGLTLADLGARVIKVEPPQGDASRIMGDSASRRDGASGTFLAFNRNKEIVRLDLKSDDGLFDALDLIAGADILIESSRPGAMERIGLGSDAMRERFPSLIYASLSAFGWSPEDQDRGGVDSVAQAESGMMSLTGDVMSGPSLIGFPVVDMAAGGALTQGILAALLSKHRTGLGDVVRVSLYDSALKLLSAPAVEYGMTRTSPVRVGNHARLTSPAGIFRCRTGSIMLSAYREAHWHRLIDRLGLPDLASDPKFKDGPSRIEYRDELTWRLEEGLAQRSAEEWVEMFRSAGLTVGLVREFSEVVAAELERDGSIVESMGDFVAVLPAFSLVETRAFSPRVPVASQR